MTQTSLFANNTVASASQYPQRTPDRYHYPMNNSSISVTDPMTTVLESSRLVCSSLDLDEVLSLILTAARNLSGAESVTVLLLDEAGEWLTIGAAIGTSERMRTDFRLRVGEGLAGWVALTGQPLHLSNPTMDPRYREVPDSHIANILALPLCVRGHMLGVLNLSQYHHAELFSATVVQMVEVFASHAAIAINNAVTASRIRRAAMREHLINQINQAVRDMEHIDEVINLALEGLGSVLEASHCALYRVHHGDTLPTLHLTHEWLLTTETGAHPWHIDQDQSTLTDYTPSLISQFRIDGAEISTPINYRGRILSWLKIYSRGRSQSWRDDELDLVRTVGDQLAIAIAQDELTLQEQRSRDLSESLRQFAAACNAMISQESLLNFILEQLARFIPYDSAGVLLNRDKNYGVIVAGRGFCSDVLHTILYLGPGSINWRVSQQRRAYISADVQQEPGWQDVPDGSLIRSWIGVPLVVNDHQIGMLTIDKWQPHAFGVADGDIAQAFADHVAVAIHNAQLYQQAQTRAHQLQALHRISIRLSAMYEVQPLLDELARLLHETFGYYQVLVGLCEGDVLVFKTARGRCCDVAEFGTQQHVALDAGLIGCSACYNQTVLVNNVSRDTHHVLHPALAETQAELIVPIQGTQHMLGMIDIHSHQAGAFNQDDVYLVEVLARQTAVALENIARYDQLRRTQDELLRSERLRALGELSSGVAHDFNNLLAGILGHTQLLLFDQTDPVVIESLSVIERAARDGAAMVRRLQDFTQNQHALPADIVDINHVIEESLAITRPLWRDAAQSHSIHIEVQRDLACTAPIMGDAPVLRELVTNLILNAIDAMPQGGTLQIRSFDSPGYPQPLSDPVSIHTTLPVVVIQVQDTGVGMTPDIQQRIFDPFFTTKGTRGTGMGLAVAHSIVQRHNGSITVQSMPGQGSTFTVILPTSHTMVPHPNPILSQIYHSLNGIRVLVVEDEQTVQQVLATLLQRWGCQVTVVSSGMEALELFQANHFDVLCTDLGMPGMSGWDVLAQIGTIDPHIRKLLITGWGEQITLMEARQRGADHMLVKPFDAATFYQALTALIADYQPSIPTDHEDV